MHRTTITRDKLIYKINDDMKSEFKLIPAVFTPFDEAGNVNYAAIPGYAEHIVESGAYGVFVCGTTGESSSMTAQEREKVLEAWIKAVKGRISVIAHVGGNCQKECIELARNAAELGADAVGAIGPCYFKPSDVEDLISWYEPVAAAAAPLPFYSYHMPSATGIRLSMKEFLHKGAERIPNLAGVKFTHNDFMEMAECVRLDGGKFDVLNGYDEMLLCGLASGAKGGVGSTYNYALPVYINICKAFADSDIEKSRMWQQKSIDIVNVIIKHGGGVRGGKAVMKVMGYDCGNCRPPFKPYSEAELSALKEELVQVGLLK